MVSSQQLDSENKGSRKKSSKQKKDRPSNKKQRGKVFQWDGSDHQEAQNGKMHLTIDLISSEIND